MQAEQYEALKARVERYTQLQQQVESLESAMVNAQTVRSNGYTALVLKDHKGEVGRVIAEGDAAAQLADDFADLCRRQLKSLREQMEAT